MSNPSWDPSGPYIEEMVNERKFITTGRDYRVERKDVNDVVFKVRYTQTLRDPGASTTG